MCENRTIGEQAEKTNVGRTGYNGVGKTPMKRGGYEAWLQKITGRSGGITGGTTVWWVFKQVTMHGITGRDEIGKGSDEQ